MPFVAAVEPMIVVVVAAAVVVEVACFGGFAVADFVGFLGCLCRRALLLVYTHVSDTVFLYSSRIHLKKKNK